jgi:cyclopropane fatty-acyl-phospholipid synthase-like methyltransferase
VPRIKQIFSRILPKQRSQIRPLHELKPGDPHYRAYVGPPERYDLIAAMVFNLLICIGLRERHRLLDIGCGSLRCGRLLIPYLNPGNYVGVEPNRWLIDEGIARETGKDLIRIKRPRFFYNDDFRFDERFGRFDFAVAQSIFSHASLQQIDTCLQSVSNRLEPSGALVATYVIGDKDYAEPTWLYPQCANYREETIAEISRRHGLEYQRLDWLHPHGQSWCLISKSGFDRSIWIDQPLSWNTLVKAGRI